MAAAVIRIFRVLFSSCFLAFVFSKSTLYMTSTPDCVSFKQNAGPIQSNEIANVISVALGFSPTKALQWSGLAQGDLFKRPSANVLVAVENVVEAVISPSFKSSRQYTVTNNGAVDMEGIKDSIVKAYGDDASIYVDLTTDSKDIKLPTKYQSILDDLPTKLKDVSNSLHGDDSVLLDIHQGTLNLSSVADMVFFSELQMLKNLLIKISEHKALTDDGVPDLYTFTLSGLRAIQTEHGVKSTQAKDAAEIVSKFLMQFSSAFGALYNDNAMVEILLSEVDPYVRRQSRSVLAAATPANGTSTLNLAGEYDENWPVFFNIFLWMGVILAVTIYAVAYLLWYMDPGDTIIYRMTSQRMKLE